MGDIVGEVDPIPRARLGLSPLPVSSAGFIWPVRIRPATTSPTIWSLQPTSLCCAVGTSAAAVDSGRPVKSRTGNGKPKRELWELWSAR